MSAIAAEALGPRAIADLKKDGFAYIDHNQSDGLKEGSKLIKDVDTFTSGHIISYEFPDEPTVYYVQEQEIDTFRYVVRKVGETSGLKELEDFYEERRLEYANMWGSCCGGKVNAGERWIYEPKQPVDDSA